MEEYSKYPVEVISGIAEETGMGMVCFLNPDTLETESVPGASYGSYECGDFDKYYQEVYRKVERRDGSHSEISNMSLMEANTVRNGLISDEDNSSGL